MATLTISYDGRNKVARNVVNFVRSLDFFSISEEPTKKNAKAVSSRPTRTWPLGEQPNGTVE